jgi:V/A-type H+-transporting ATPase subunit C
MKGALIKQEQWAQLLKMGPNELLRWMQDSGYKPEIDDLGVDKRDLTQLEMALTKNFMRTLTKLHRISDEKVQQVLKVYVKRYDLDNFKTIIRGKMTHVASDELRSLLVPSINHTLEYFDELLAMDNVEQILKALPYEVAGDDLFAIENALDRAHFEELSHLIERIRGQGAPMRAFLQAELDNMNIKLILRLKKEEFEDEDIRKYLISPSTKMLELVDEKDIASIIAKLRKEKHVVIEGDNPELADLEIDLDTALLKKERLLMHQHPLTVSVILGFMLAKEIEVKNLKVLIKGKMLGLEEQYLEKLLVVQ